MPGLATLNKGVNAEVSSVSCSSAGNCGASGDYTDKAGNLHGFLVSQAGGRWRTAIKVPGIASRPQLGSAGVRSLSCVSVGNCSSGADYANSSGQAQAYAVSEVRGSWRTALEVPGTAALNKGNNAQVSTISCSSPGRCAVGGYFTGKNGYTQAFVVNEG